MPRLFRPPQAKGQPSVWTPINRANPLTKGLVGFWYPVGSRFASAIPGIADATINSTGRMVTQAKGRALAATGTFVQTGTLKNDPRWKPTTGITVLAEGTTPSTSSTFAYWFGCETSNDGFGMYVDSGGTNLLRPYLRVGAAWADQASGIGLAAQAQVGMTFDGTTFWSVANGARVNSQAISGTITNSATDLALTDLSASGGGLGDGSFYYFAVWNRALTPDELKSFNLNPWQVLRPAMGRDLIEEPAASGTPADATPAAGAATVTASGASLAASTGTAAAGVATVSAAGRALSASTATQAAGVATVSATGGALFTATATAATGLAAVSAAASAAAASSGTAPGAATVSSVGASLAASAGTAAGVASASGAGSSLAATTATAAAGAATVSASSAGGAGSTATAAAGAATVSAAGSSKAASAGQAAGTATVSAVGASAFRAAASAAAGSTVASAAGQALSAAAGSAAGSAVVSANGSSKAASTATAAAGAAVVSGVGASLGGAVANAIAAAGSAVVSAIASSLARASGLAQGVATVSASSSLGAPPVLGSILGRTRQAFGIRSSVQTATRKNEQSSKR